MRSFGSVLRNSDIGDALKDIYQRTGEEPPSLPEGACESCWEIHDCHECHDARFVRRNLPVSDPDFGKRQLCPACHGYSGDEDNAMSEPTQEEQEAKLRIPRLFSHVTWDMLSEGQAEAISDIIRPHPSKPMVTLSGSVGAGKSTAAAVALKESLRNTGKAGRFYAVVDLLDRFKATYDEDRAVETVATIEAEMRATWLLVLDDLGKHKSTQWAEERLFKLVDERYRERKPLIVTTNVPRDSFEPATASRVFGSHSEVVEFRGADRRMQ